MKIPSLPSERPRAAGFLAFLGLAFLLCFPYAEATRNANELPRLVQGMALWETGQWAIDGPAARRLPLGPDVARSPKDGRLYPNKPPGTAVACALAYGLARGLHPDDLDLRTYTWWARLLTGVVPTWALAAFLTLRLVPLFGREASFAAIAMLTLGTPLLSYAHLAYGHALAACFAVLGVWGCIDAVTRAEVARAAGFGALAAAAVTVEYGAVFCGVPLAVFLVASVRQRGRAVAVAAALAGALVPIAALAAYQDAVFGSPWATGYHHVIEPDFVRKHGQGLLGLGLPRARAAYVHLLSPSTGLLWWVPTLPAAVYGLAVAASGPKIPRRDHARVALATLLLYGVVLCSLSFEGGWRVGPRYFAVALPFCAIGFAEIVTQCRTTAGWLLAIVALSTYAFVTNVWAANLWPHFDPTNLHHPVAEVLWPLWREHAEPYGLLRAWFGIDGLRICVYGSVAGGLLALAHTVEPRLVTILGFATGVGVGLAAVVAVERWPQHPRGRQNLAYVRGVWEPDHRVPGDPPSFRIAALSPEDIERARLGPVPRGAGATRGPSFR